MKYFLIVTLLFLTCSSNSLKWNTKKLLQKQKTIYIIPLNGVNQNDVLLSSNELQNFYHYNVIVLTQDVIPNNIKSQTSGKYNSKP